MKMTTMYGCRRLTCEVSALTNARIDSDVSGGYGEDTIRYAVCRFLKKSPGLCRKYVTESYLMRIAGTRREKLPRRHSFLAPAGRLELPGHLVRVQVTVSPSGVTVERIGWYSAGFRGKLRAEEVLNGAEV